MRTRWWITNCLNAFEKPISEERESVRASLPGSRTNGNVVAARFLLKPRRRHEDAAKAFEPYERVKEENFEARAAAKALVEEGRKAGPARKTFVLVNNRLEGNAFATVAAVT